MILNAKNFPQLFPSFQAEADTKRSREIKASNLRDYRALRKFCGVKNWNHLEAVCRGNEERIIRGM